MKKNSQEKLTLEQYRLFFEQLNSLGAVILGFTGGEPLLDNRLFDIIRMARPQRFVITIHTNGFLISNDKLKECKKAGVDWLIFGLDSMDKSENNELRDHDAYEKVMEAIELSRNKGMKVGINTTVSHHNARSSNFTALLEWAKGEHLPVFLVLAAQAGKWRGMDEVSLTKEDVNYIENEIFYKYPNTLLDYRNNYFKEGCSAGHEKFYLTAYGDVIPCPFIHITFGNIKEERVATIRERLISCKYFDYWPVCLSAIDESFRRKYMSKTFERESLPISLKEAGLLDR